MVFDPNSSSFPPFFHLEPLGIPPSKTYLAIFVGTVIYCFIVVGNMTIILSISLSRSLHKPMYLLLLSLPTNDLIGSTAFFPQLICNIALEERTISSAACFLQGLLVHLYATGAFIFLTAMALDRFLAICRPLRYNTLMSHSNLLKIVMAIWLLDLFLVVVLFSLLARFPFCGNTIPEMSCNNPSLVKLICGDTTINKNYALLLDVVLPVISISIVLFTYIQILVACLTNKQSDTKSKAVRTCATHLTVYMLYLFTSMFTVLSHLFSHLPSYLRTVAGVSMFLFPCMLNPVIYGLNTKEIRSVVVHFITKKKGCHL